MSALPRVAPPRGAIRDVDVCALDELPPGERRIVEAGNDRRVGVFNVDGELVAYDDRCPHMGGAACHGRVTGTTAADGDGGYAWRADGRVLRCAWHGWEFDLTDGRYLVDPALRLRRFPVNVADGRIVVTVPA